MRGNDDGLIPEVKLLIAILDNAKDSYSHGGKKEVDLWLDNNDVSHPASFLNICSLLGLSADAVKARIREKASKKRPYAQIKKSVMRWRSKNRSKYLSYLRRYRVAQRLKKGVK